MKKILFIAILLCIGFGNFVAAGNGVKGGQPVIPQPAKYDVTEGVFTVPQTWLVGSDLSQKVVEKLLKVLKHPYEIAGKNDNKQNLILIEDHSLGEEAYVLNVDPSKVTITAHGEKGFYYALQTLYQLAYLKGVGNEIACCEITDSPRFGYRAMMLDATRYFIPKEEVLKMIDIASALKFNNVHMHLTDDNGWRLEIKKYPELTNTGAWRVARPEIFPGRMNAKSADEPTPEGGFYTQDDMREIVAYAADRYINVIPEIEMPAHAAAAIASYPELACPVVDKFVGVFPGIGGPDASIIMCGGNEKVYDFYCDVLDEVMDIFPSQFIHLGGDEADKRIWQQCPLCNAKIEAENLDGYEGLQAYFMDRINSYVRSKGRTAMGWDEVTYGDPKEDMVILGWQGMGQVAVKDARKSGRKFIMTPAKIMYLIRYQGPQWYEPFTYFGNNTIKDVYNYEPVGNDWTPEMREQLLGVQGSLWTEFCKSDNDVEYQMFPRLLAVSDVAWRPEGSGDWESFTAALDNYLPELESRGINYAKSMYNIQHKAEPDGEGVIVNLGGDRDDFDIIYTKNGEPTPLKYSGPIKVDGNTSINAVTSRDGQKMGQPLDLNFKFNKATGKPVSSPGCNNELGSVLTNGLRGSEKHSDFEWAGWHAKDAEFVVDLQEVQDINNCKLGTIGFSHVCVVMPEKVDLYGSEDGNDYVLLGSVATPEELIYSKESTKHEIDFGKLGKKARYLKFVGKNPGTIPAGYAREGAPTWVYFDEVTVE